MLSILGLDIGGANTKGCRFGIHQGEILQVEGASYYYEVWKDPLGLKEVLKTIKHQMDKNQEYSLRAIALTMTAELCDIFLTKADGVKTILQVVEEAFVGVPIYVWTLQGLFVSPADVKSNPLDAAAVNWLASAQAIAHSPLLETNPVLLIDMGSTTTDILPLAHGRVDVQGYTDLERLLAGELVYTGVLRTQVNSIVDHVYVNGHRCRVASEYFAITADVYRVLDLIREEDYDVATPDGGAKDFNSCARRLARIVASEPDVLGDDGILTIANNIEEMQIQQIMEGIWQVRSRTKGQQPRLMVTASQGSFLLEKIATRLGWKAVPWWEVIPGAGPNYALTAYAAGWLLARQLDLISRKECP